jgi:hypothetical protein
VFRQLASAKNQGASGTKSGAGAILGVFGVAIGSQNGYIKKFKKTILM